MKPPEVLPAISYEAVFGKSKAFAQRALRCKQAEDYDEYQLWASLALELLGKACLTRVHPSLIVNPLDHISLFAASGISIGTDIKTIAAHTLFERLRLVVKGFDERAKKFCDDISQRRNAELHSGEIPFREMKLSAWEATYWHAVQLILFRMDATLEEWLGAGQAQAPLQIVQHARQATIAAAIVRVERAAETFGKRPKKQREAALKEAVVRGSYSYRDALHVAADDRWRVPCPACQGNGIMGGIMFHEEVIEHYPGTYEEGWPDEELVEKLFASEEFFCPVCELSLDGQDEIEAAGLPTEHTDTKTRERRYEEEYNNE